MKKDITENLELVKNWTDNANIKLEGLVMTKLANLITRAVRGDNCKSLDLLREQMKPIANELERISDCLGSDACVTYGQFLSHQEIVTEALYTLEYADPKSAVKLINHGERLLLAINLILNGESETKLSTIKADDYLEDLKPEEISKTLESLHHIGCLAIDKKGNDFIIKIEPKGEKFFEK